MMLNKMPANTSLHSILDYLETSTKWGARNRALFALRQRLRIKDISALQVSDVLGLHGAVRGHYIAKDGTAYLLDEALRAELNRYLISRFQPQGNSLKSLINTDLDVPLFPTQKRERFSNNTLAQHFCLLDKDVWQRFAAHQANRERRYLNGL
jgi:integrase/recombinase XerD